MKHLILPVLVCVIVIAIVIGNIFITCNNVNIETKTSYTINNGIVNKTYVMNGFIGKTFIQNMNGNYTTQNELDSLKNNMREYLKSIEKQLKN